MPPRIAPAARESTITVARCVLTMRAPRSSQARPDAFAAIFSAATPVEVRFTIILLLLGYLLTKIFIVEQGRIPVDDPRTHLELTMIHEAMCLDYGGIDLAFIQIAGWLKERDGGQGKESSSTQPPGGGPKPKASPKPRASSTRKEK